VKARSSLLFSWSIALSIAPGCGSSAVTSVTSPTETRCQTAPFAPTIAVDYLF
jgi:hypothetical protein